MCLRVLMGSLWLQQSTFESSNLLDVPGLMSRTVYRSGKTRRAAENEALPWTFQTRWHANVFARQLFWRRHDPEGGGGAHLKIRLPRMCFSAADNNAPLHPFLLLLTVSIEVPVLLFPHEQGHD